MRPTPSSSARTVLREARLVQVDSPPTGTAPVDLVVAGGRVQVHPAGLTIPEPTDEVVHLDGRWVVPGLWDAHTHMTQWALARRRLDVSTATSAAQAAALVARQWQLSPPPPGMVLIGAGFRDGLWPDVPSTALLDEATAGAAVVLVSADLHCGWLSTAAARLLGVGWGPDGGPDGTGLLREQEWFAVLDRLGEAPDDVADAWVADAAAAAARRGVVGVVDFETSGTVDAWVRRIGAGQRGLRVVTSVWPDGLDDVVERGVRTGDVLDGTDGLAVMGSLKVISDGSLNTRTAFCHDPYPGLRGPASHGVLSVPPDVLVPLMTRAAAAGLSCAIHAIGDRAITLAVDAFAASGARGSIEHAQLLVDADVRRMADLDLTASVQPEHAMDDRDVADRYWAGRTDRAFTLRTLHEAGVRLALGSDAPVAPLDPWLAIGAAAERSRDGREPWHAEQCVPVQVALAASTRGRGTVRSGDVADLAVLDADPLAARGAALRATPVTGTLLDGRWTHREI